MTRDEEILDELARLRTLAQELERTSPLLSNAVRNVHGPFIKWMINKKHDKQDLDSVTSVTTEIMAMMFMELMAQAKIQGSDIEDYGTAFMNRLARNMTDYMNIYARTQGEPGDFETHQPERKNDA